MKLLVCGGSDIFARRVLPSLASLGITAVEIASRSGRRLATPPDLPLRYVDDAETALATSDAPVVYVTTENSRHAPLVLAALAAGRHVIVDKPAFLDLATAQKALALAARKNLVLAEATVWADHPRAAAILQAFADRKSMPTRLVATFSFPPLSPANFRHVPELGGGALFDLGPYAVSPGRILFGTEPEDIFCRIAARGPAVETAFACQFTYPGGHTLVGTFGFDTGYINRLDVLGPDLAVTMDRAFTPPPNAALTLATNSPQGSQTLTFEPADAFARFFARFFAAMEHGDGGAFATALLADARTLERLRESAR